MSPAVDYSKGALLLMITNSSEVVATSLNANGAKKNCGAHPFQRSANDRE